MAIQVSEQLEDQAEFKGALSTRSKLAVNSEQFVAQVVGLRSDNASPDRDTNDFVSNLRQLASDRLATLSFPTTKDEEWKYTDVSALGTLTFANQPAIASRTANLEALIANNIAPESLGNCLVFVNGKYRKDLSDTSAATEGLVIGTLANLGDRLLPKLRSHLAQHPDANDYFASLNTACMEDVAIILAPKNLVVENPVQLLFISAPQAGEATLITQPRCLVIAETHSQLTFVQTFVGENNHIYFTNAVTEVWLAEGAQVNHTKVQQQGNEAFHINTTAIAQARNSVYKNQAISFGAKISRQNLIVHQMAEQTETSLTGLAFIDNDQLADTHSCIAHNYPHGSSKQLHKCIADGRSHAIFNGKIQVAKLAQQTDSAQLSRNLLLSGKARVDTKPQLEIFADNVKCAHGATVSQLDAEEIFYLQSRAIDAESAANLLTYAFATEAIAQIPILSVQRSLSSFVLAKTKDS
ncbi:Fe-S cluster assembly protein SufD [Pseudanabaena sp. 'Roaring Creek']|uniref:Fe-S cluster assembly protein SufD n=1 Tax=Pseudanabaena sp. 'Roaring Creek' TaxID=1681830 RepID=UPI0006D83651|nr:Fe-S cluster assembly protein SufD [Pseudanabaena sp. 'Roaring Creek']